MSKLLRGTDILTDNWLFLVVADFLNNNVDPTEQWRWIGTSQNDVISDTIDAGAFQLDCLINLIEQIVFSNSIHLLEKWIPTWSKKNSELNQLLIESHEKFIVPVSHSEDISESRNYWLSQLLSNSKLKDLVEHGIKDYKDKKPNSPYAYWSQVVDGAALYLAVAEINDLTYAPHTARAGFLRSGKWETINTDTKGYKGQRIFNEIINTSRVNLLSILRETDSLTRLKLQIPSVAMLCVAESSESQSPIEIALQLRNNSEIKNLRQVLHEITKSTSSDSGHLTGTITDVKMIEQIILNVEKEIADSGKIEPNHLPTQINLEYFNCKEIESESKIAKFKSKEHSGLISRLLMTTSYRANQLLRDKLKLNPRAIKQYIEWHQNGFFYKVNPKTIINEVNVKVEKNINKGTAINVGSGANFTRARINQSNFTTSSEGIDPKSLSTELESLLKVMRNGAIDPNHFKECESIAESIQEIEKGNLEKAVESIQKVGKWTFNFATQIGAGIIVEIIKRGTL